MSKSKMNKNLPSRRALAALFFWCVLDGRKMNFGTNFIKASVYRYRPSAVLFMCSKVGKSWRCVTEQVITDGRLSGGRQKGGERARARQIQFSLLRGLFSLLLLKELFCLRVFAFKELFSS
jgi:hypothetical protein